MQDALNGPPKPVTVDFSGEIYNFAIKTQPFTAGDDLWVEAKKLDYLAFIGAARLDDHLYRKARSLATFELVTIAGIPTSPNPPPGVSPMTLGVLSLPVQVVNDVVKQYFAQFKAVKLDDPLP